jgi:hypothetical protein
MQGESQMKDDRPEDELRHACLTPPLPSWSPTRWAVNLKTAGSMMTAANGQCLSQSSKSNIRRTGEEKTPSSNVAMIHEAGAMAVAKSHSRSPHRINTEGADGLIHNSLVLNASVSTEISGAPDPFNNPTFLAALRTSKTATLLNLPLTGIRSKRWRSLSGTMTKTTAPMARSAWTVTPGEDSAAIERMKTMSLTPGWRWSNGGIVRPKLALAAASASS